MSHHESNPVFEPRGVHVVDAVAALEHRNPAISNLVARDRRGRMLPVPLG